MEWSFREKNIYIIIIYKIQNIIFQKLHTTYRYRVRERAFADKIEHDQKLFCLKTLVVFWYYNLSFYHRTTKKTKIRFDDELLSDVNFVLFLFLFFVIQCLISRLFSTFFCFVTYHISRETWSLSFPKCFTFIICYFYFLVVFLSVKG